MPAAVEVRMPRLADTLVEGTVARWLKQVGDTVAAGEPLAEIETDKVTTELPAPAAGVVAELAVPPGTTVAVDTVIARIGGSGPAETGPAETVPGPRATSLAARLLAEHGLRPADVAPADPSGRLTRADVLRHVAERAAAAEAAPTAAEAAPTAAGPGARPSPAGRLQPVTATRRSIAEHMARARATIPHGQTVVAADLTRLAAWRAQVQATFEARTGVRLSYTSCFAAAFARALARQQAAGRAPGGAVDLGVAVAIEGGLVVPVLRAADRLTLGEVARGIHDLADRARAGRLAPGETTGAVATLSNVGSFGNLLAYPIVPLRQVGILGPGLVEPRPLPGSGGSVRPGWQCLVSLVFDRRSLDELAADRLLRSVVGELDALPRAEERPAPEGAPGPGRAAT